ncbi:MAG: DUF1302 family protein, partial [Oleiphilaceae bacterium]|nr:DUF1302 family protein [Oleiphilaceae bacterium]
MGNRGLKQGAVVSFLAAGLLAMPNAQALNWEFEFAEDIVEVDLLNTLSVGAAWRVEERDESLIGKASLPQNRDLCAQDNCIGLTEDATEPNARFLAAPGALASYADDGSINYDKGDLVAGAAKLSSRLNMQWRNYGLEITGLYFYDQVNTDFTETHPNRITTLGARTGEFVKTKRASEAEDEIGNNFELRNFNVFADFTTPWGRDATIRVGRQLLNWGVSAFGVNGSLNFVNAPDLNALTRAGFELFELYKPQGMVTLKTDLTDHWTFEGFYQYEWRTVGLPPKGAFFSFFDAGAEVVEDDHIPLPFSKTPEDPDQLQRPSDFLLSGVTDTSFAAKRAPNNEPKDGGQYGLAFYYFNPDFLNGTEFGFYYANYHARIPSASFFAADAACTRREGNARNNDTSNVVEFLIDCEATVDLPGLLGASDGLKLTNRDALPIDSARYFLDYPEDINAYGVSFNTTGWGAAIQG